MGICGVSQQSSSSCTGRFDMGVPICSDKFSIHDFYHLPADIISLVFLLTL